MTTRWCYRLGRRRSGAGGPRSIAGRAGGWREAPADMPQGRAGGRRGARKLDTCRGERDVSCARAIDACSSGGKVKEGW